MGMDGKQMWPSRIDTAKDESGSNMALVSVHWMDRKDIIPKRIKLTGRDIAST